MYRLYTCCTYNVRVSCDDCGKQDERSSVLFVEKRPSLLYYNWPSQVVVWGSMQAVLQRPMLLTCSSDYTVLGILLVETPPFQYDARLKVNDFKNEIIITASCLSAR